MDFSFGILTSSESDTYLEEIIKSIEDQKIPNYEIILMTTSKMFWPIIYTVLTTIFAFLSLIFSDIQPIIDFGWMMTFGLITSLVITFTLLPTLLNPSNLTLTLS